MPFLAGGTRKYPDSSLIYFPNAVDPIFFHPKVFARFCGRLNVPTDSFFSLSLIFTTIFQMIFPAIYSREGELIQIKRLLKSRRIKNDVYYVWSFFALWIKLNVCIVLGRINLEILTSNDRCSLIVFSSQFVNDNLASGQWDPAVSQSKSTKFWNSHYYLDYVNILKIIQHRINWDFINSWGQVLQQQRRERWERFLVHIHL